MPAEIVADFEALFSRKFKLRKLHRLHRIHQLLSGSNYFDWSGATDINLIFPEKIYHCHSANEALPWRVFTNRELNFSGFRLCCLNNKLTMHSCLKMKFSLIFCPLYVCRYYISWCRYDWTTRSSKSKNIRLSFSSLRFFPHRSIK